MNGTTHSEQFQIAIGGGQVPVIFYSSCKGNLVSLFFNLFNSFLTCEVTKESTEDNSEERSDIEFLLLLGQTDAQLITYSR